MKDTSMLFTNPECQRIVMAINVEPEASLMPNVLLHTQTLKPYMQRNLKRQMAKVENYRVAKLHPHWLIGGRLE
jgi:hypothetical protein